MWSIVVILTWGAYLIWDSKNFDEPLIVNFLIWLLSVAGWYVGWFLHVWTMSAFDRLLTSPAQLFFERNGTAATMALIFMWLGFQLLGLG